MPSLRVSIFSPPLVDLFQELVATDGLPHGFVSRHRRAELCEALIVADGWGLVELIPAGGLGGQQRLRLFVRREQGLQPRPQSTVADAFPVEPVPPLALRFGERELEQQFFTGCVHRQVGGHRSRIDNK